MGTPDRPDAHVQSSDSPCRPDCELCGGIGYIRHDLHYTHPMFGRVELCPNVDHWQFPFARRFGITKDEAERLGWTFVLDGNNARRGVTAARALLSRGYGWLYLWGEPGLAKTLILKIAVAEWLRQEKTGSYARMAAIIDHMRAAFDTDEPSIASEERLSWWADVPLLAVDELDRFRPTDFAQERAYLLFDRRYEDAAARKSATIFASNRAPSDLPPYLADRVYDGRFEIVKLQGESYRPLLRYEDKNAKS